VQDETLKLNWQSGLKFWLQSRTETVNTGIISNHSQALAHNF